MRLLVLIGIAAVCLAISSNATAGEEIPDPSNDMVAPEALRMAPVTTAAQKQALDAVIRGTWDFAVNLYKNVGKVMDGSFVTAPLSLSVTLAMATYGASQNTKVNLMRVLGLSNQPAITARTGYEQLIKGIKNDEFSSLRVVNEVDVLPDGPQMTDKFWRKNKDRVGAIQQWLDDHYTEYEKTRIMKQWIGAQRDQETMDIIAMSDISFNPMLVLANTFYFEGGWERHFDDTLTEMRRFWYKGLVAGLTTTMYARRIYRYGQLPEVKSRFVELPYQSNSTENALSMFIILPDEKDGLAYLEENLEKISLKNLFKKNYKILDLYLPKFKIENYLWLEGVLQTMGLTEMFTSDANFDKISMEDKLRGEGVGHAAVLDASNTGTNLGLSLARMVPPVYHDLPGEEWFNTIHNDPIQFQVDHPFIALVTTRGKNPISLLTARFTGH